MRKILNTLYVTNESAYLSVDGENIVVSVTGQKDFRLPLCKIEEVVCFNYMGCSPKLMGKCVENKISISFVTPNGKFLARIIGETKGNVFTRINQIDIIRDSICKLHLIQNSLAAKFVNTKFLLSRSLRDYPEINDDGQVGSIIEKINNAVKSIYNITDENVLRGIEGDIAKDYFAIFGRLIRNNEFSFNGRSKRPPLDEINAVLSLLYTLQANSITSALETAGIDPYIGFFHTQRPGRASLSLDILEEFRATIDRFVISIFNLKQVNRKDFEKKAGGAVLLNNDGRHKVIKLWQEKKKEIIIQPFINEKIHLGLLPYMQASLLGKYIRKEIAEYPPYINK